MRQIKCWPEVQIRYGQLSGTKEQAGHFALENPEGPRTAAVQIRKLAMELEFGDF
jgi:hypothetical protein